MKLWNRLLGRPETGSHREEAREALETAESELARVKRQAPLVEAYSNRFQLHLSENGFGDRAVEAMRRTAAS